MTPELEPLNALVGEWTTEATHPALPDTVVPGRITVEWLEGGRFLVHRAATEHPDFPDGISIIGATDEDEDSLTMHYFDSRGVFRVYRVSIRDDVWRIWREAPGFSQRFAGGFSEDGDTFSGTWELSRDDATWDEDLKITYRRAG